MLCPCGSSNDYSDCCQPYLNLLESAPTPEALMRSRYCAFALGEAEYLVATSLIKNHAVNELEQLQAQMNLVAWLQLDIITAYDNFVEFKAYYRDESGIQVLHEKSTFVYQENRWFYEEGTLFNTKIERNEPCPCASGKKYKKCCARHLDQ